MIFSTAWSAEAEAYIRSLAPEARRAVRSAVKSLAEGRGARGGRGRADVRALEGRLQGYWRLRVGTHRIIYTHTADENGPRLDFLFAAPRSIIYEAFERILAEKLSG